MGRVRRRLLAERDGDRDRKLVATTGGWVEVVDLMLFFGDRAQFLYR
jgi:hypothetical protein